MKDDLPGTFASTIQQKRLVFSTQSRFLCLEMKPDIANPNPTRYGCVPALRKHISATYTVRYIDVYKLLKEFAFLLKSQKLMAACITCLIHFDALDAWPDRRSLLMITYVYQ